MKKLIPVKNLEKYAWREFSKYIRTLYCLKTTDSLNHGKCYTCDGLFNISDLDAGHFSKATNKETKFSEDNVRPQCTKCNCYLDGNEGIYAVRLIDEIGRDKVDWIIAQKGKVRKFSRAELEEIRSTYKLKTKELEARC